MTFDYKKNHENIQHYPFLWGPEAKPPRPSIPLGRPAKAQSKMARNCVGSCVKTLGIQRTKMVENSGDIMRI